MHLFRRGRKCSTFIAIVLYDCDLDYDKIGNETELLYICVCYLCVTCTIGESCVYYASF